jgi:hypothetical protein
MQTLAKRSLFWDVRKVDPEKNSGFVIGRILRFGDEADFRWAKKTYGSAKLKNELLRAKSLDDKSLAFWCRYFNIYRKQCISNQSIKNKPRSGKNKNVGRCPGFLSKKARSECGLTGLANSSSVICCFPSPQGRGRTQGEVRKAPDTADPLAAS